MPLIDLSYRIYGEGLVPITPDVRQAILQTLLDVYPEGNVTQTFDLFESPSAPVFTVTRSPDGAASMAPAPAPSLSTFTSNATANSTGADFPQFQSVDVISHSKWAANSLVAKVGGIESSYNWFDEQSLAQQGIMVRIFPQQFNVSRPASAILARVPYPPLTTGTAPKASGAGMPAGAIAGIVVAAVGVTCLAAMAVAWKVRRRKAHRPADPELVPYGSAVLKMPFDDISSAGANQTLPADRGMPKELTDFQKAALQLGIVGEAAFPQLKGMTDTDSSDKRSGPSTTSGETLSSTEVVYRGLLTDHRAGNYLEGSDIPEGEIEICQRPDGSRWVLGNGSFGTVFLAVRGGVQNVAVKMLTRLDQHQLDQFKKEISMLKKLSYDRNIVQFYGACMQEGKPMLVLEYMEGGDLRQAMSSAQGAELRWYQKGQLIALDIARAMHFLHSNKVMHSDLKTGNILLTKDYSCAKIGDVGLARIMDSQYMTNTQMGGTFAYAAPELLLNQRCSEKVDIYSFGVVLFELVSGEQPQRGKLRDLRVPEECPASIARMIDACLAIDPAQRPTAKELFNTIRDTLDAPQCGSAPSVSSLGTHLVVTDDELRNSQMSSQATTSSVNASI
ncbi:hypothetical protein WJX72_006471 [[Myrmecia] bisecta]|uniref:Protein kinase domain-containing protein n=1 Tax=[Myrmecia] bisecta TaxID=41462 RepID=A0AAW1R7F5_9CHLO